MNEHQDDMGNGIQDEDSTREFPIHQLCSVFPDLPEEELEELAESIRRDGQQEPAVIYEGQLLDGKNRQAACKLAGKDLLVRNLEPGVEPSKFVAQRNLLRRNLTTSQRAAMGAELKKWFVQKAEKRMKAGKAPDPSANLREGSKASEEAAKLVKVSARTIEAAEKVQKESPALFEEVRSGKKTVNAALAQLPKRKLAESPPRSAKSKDNFVVVLWDDQDGVREPVKFANRKTYPDIVYFHFWDQQTFRLKRLNWCVLFAVTGAEEKVINAHGVPLCQSPARFLSLSVNGNVPVPAIIPKQVVDGALEGVIRMVGEAWPSARKILVSNQKQAPEGWELLNEPDKG